MAFLGIHYHLLGPFGEIHRIWEGFPGGSVVKGPPAVQKMQGTRARSWGREGPLEEGTATHSSIRAWRTPWTEEPGGLQSTGSKESDLTSDRARTRWLWGKEVTGCHFSCLPLQGFRAKACSSPGCPGLPRRLVSHSQSSALFRSPSLSLGPCS